MLIGFELSSEYCVQRPMITVQKYRSGVKLSRERVATKIESVFAILSMIGFLALISLFYFLFFLPSLE